MKFLTMLCFLLCAIWSMNAETMSDFITNNGCNPHYSCNGGCKKVSACHFARLHQETRYINETASITIQAVDGKQLSSLNLSLLNTILIFALFAMQLFFCWYFLRSSRGKDGKK